jgi:hypothetical protein
MADLVYQHPGFGPQPNMKVNLTTDWYFHNEGHNMPAGIMEKN